MFWHKIPHHHPFDWVQHFLLCLIITLISGRDAGAWSGVIVELVQVDVMGIKGRVLDTGADLVADALGVWAGLYLRGIYGY
jgi:hypothetical protein